MNGTLTSREITVIRVALMKRLLLMRRREIYKEANTEERMKAYEETVDLLQKLWVMREQIDKIE